MATRPPFRGPWSKREPVLPPEDVSAQEFQATSSEQPPSTPPNPQRRSEWLYLQDLQDQQELTYWNRVSTPPNPVLPPPDVSAQEFQATSYLQDLQDQQERKYWNRQATSSEQQASIPPNPVRKGRARLSLRRRRKRYYRSWQAQFQQQEEMDQEGDQFPEQGTIEIGHGHGQGPGETQESQPRVECPSWVYLQYLQERTYWERLSALRDPKEI